MSAWLHVDRQRSNRPIPFCGVTAAMPDLRVLATTEFDIERLSFVRDPGHVRPMYPLTRGAKYFADRYRLRVPAWELDLFSEPLVAGAGARAADRVLERADARAGQHGRPPGARLRLPRAHVRLHARLRAGRRPARDAAPPAGSAFPPGSPGRCAGDLVWEVDAFLSHGGRADARHHLRTRVRPPLERLAEPARATCCRSLTTWTRRCSAARVCTRVGA